MAEHRLTNSELHLAQLAEEEARREKERGILELFRDPEPEPDEDAPLGRDPG
jgi:hypothetical protein